LQNHHNCRGLDDFWSSASPAELSSWKTWLKILPIASKPVHPSTAPPYNPLNHIALIFSPFARVDIVDVDISTQSQKAGKPFRGPSAHTEKNPQLRCESAKAVFRLLFGCGAYVVQRSHFEWSIPVVSFATLCAKVSVDSVEAAAATPKRIN
jgi:hypothetical protein